MIYGVYNHSHWQGSGADVLIATGSEAACERMVECLDSCTMCRSRVGGGYGIGRCLLVRKVGYASRRIRELPEDAVTWEAADFAQWEEDQYGGD